jgi:MSHA pilin protein MshC
LNNLNNLNNLNMQPSLRSNKGFTLIELIVVIVVLGILSTFALSRFQGRGGFVEYTYQARLIAALRNMQQRAMQDVIGGGASGFYRINISTAEGEFGPPYDPSDFSAIDHSDESLATVVGEISADNVIITTLDAAAAASFTFVHFSAMGLPTNDANPTNSCASGCTINFVGEATATVCIESQGYIHGGNCG